MDLNRIEQQFIEQYVNYLPNGNYKVKVNESDRFGNGAECSLFLNDAYQGCWWVEEVDGKYEFEQEFDTKYARIGVRVDHEEEFGVYYKNLHDDGAWWEEEDKLEDATSRQFEQRYRELFAQRILDGTYKLKFICNDTDGWEAPLSKIQHKIITI